MIAREPSPTRYGGWLRVVGGGVKLPVGADLQVGPDHATCGAGLFIKREDLKVLPYSACHARSSNLLPPTPDDDAEVPRVERAQALDDQPLGDTVDLGVIGVLGG